MEIMLRTGHWIISLSFFAIVFMSCGAKQDTTSDGENSSKPNIVYILADDMGYGDVSVLNKDAAWTTPNLDKLASEGVSFTDAHSGSAVCSPTRYGILTGRYAWRSTLKNGVLWSWDTPLIEPDRMTVGQLLKSKGYSTACVGKWHLGLGWRYFKDHPDSVDFSLPLTGGPMTNGFDYFYGIPASLDIPPYVYIKNDLPTKVPVKYTRNEDKYGWWRNGLTGSDFHHEQVLPHLTNKVVDFIDQHMAKKTGDPFFIYFPLPAPHTPILPTKEFKGKSGTNPYGDFVLQVDWTVGEVMKALSAHGIAENTVFIFTSDNGCSPEANFEVLSDFGHDPSYIYRGTKADIFEGGHRVPFIVRWPAKVDGGKATEHITCLTNLMATTADIVGAALPENAGEDSYSILPALLSESNDHEMVAIINHSINGSFALRQDEWKLIMCPGSGGWSSPKPKEAKASGLSSMQLYNLNSDPSEKRNVVNEYPEIVKSMKEKLEALILNGRSTQGPNLEYVMAEEWPGLEWMK